MSLNNTELVTYLEAVLTERHLSQPALALGAGIPGATIRRIMRGGTPDPITLIKIAMYLNEPIHKLFRLAGWASNDDELKAQLILVAKYLLQKLPEESQRSMYELAREMISRRQQAPDNEGPERARDAN